MTATSTYCLESVSNTKISISPEGLRSLFFQTEAELHRSEAYRRAMNGLQKSADAAEGFQAMIKAVGREAIRLALRQLVKQSHTAPTSAQVTLDATANPFDASEVPVAAPSEPPLVSDRALPYVTTASRGSGFSAAMPKSGIAQKQRVQSAADLEQREAALRQVGETLKQARLAKSWSIEQIHSQTWVPTYHLKALEAGLVEQLPEDIYVRGFIRRAGDVLGLNGTELAAAIPGLEAARTVIPSWAKSTTESPCLQPIHLYVGYAALMAGAVGGLAWMSQQPQVADAFHWSPDQSKSVSQSEMRVNPTMNLNAGGTHSAVAPPENVAF